MGLICTCSDLPGRRVGRAPPSSRTLIVAVAVACVVLASTATAKIIYVDDDAPPGGDGRSWQTAYRYLQDALQEGEPFPPEPPGNDPCEPGGGVRAMVTALSDSGDSPTGIEIRVAQGIYKPDQGIRQTPSDRTASFELTNGVGLKGGYAGLGMPDPNARDIALYETILSGDLAGDDVEVSDPCDLEREPTRSDNSYHVVYILYADDTLLLEGFTVTGGYAWVIGGPGRDAPSELYSGGGLRCVLSEDPTIAKCTFRSNCAEMGGGIYNYASGPNITSCSFIKNAAVSAGGFGGGMENIYNSSPKVSYCTFSHNYAGGGGGVSHRGGKPEYTHCTFRENRASGAYIDDSDISFEYCRFGLNFAARGGGIHSGSANCTLINCLFEGNSAKINGGAIALLSRDNVTVTNCTFSKNVSPSGSAFSFENRKSTIRIVSSILWDGGQEIWNGNNSTVTVTYTDAFGGWPGEGNMDVDPLFAEPNNGDYHLKSQAGRWDPATQSWVTDNVTSPCIDAGNPGSPIGLEPFPNGGIINMGAYGGTAEASKSYFGKPVCQTIIAGDVNGDCRVDLTDVVILARHWLREYTPPNTLMNTYRFLPEESSIVAYCGRGGIKNYSIDGQFGLTASPAAGESAFCDVNAVLDNELSFVDVGGLISSKQLDVVFHMTELLIVDVTETQITCAFHKEIPAYPNADVNVEVVFEGNSLSLTGTFSDAARDRCWYQMTARAIPK